MVAIAVFAAALCVLVFRRRHPSAFSAERLEASVRPVALVAVLALVVGTAVGAWPAGDDGSEEDLSAAVLPLPTPSVSFPSPRPEVDEPAGEPAPDGEARDGVGLGRSRLIRDRDGNRGPGDELGDITGSASRGGDGDFGGGGSGGGGGGGGPGGGDGGGGSGDGGGGGDPEPTPTPTEEPTPSPTEEPSPSPTPTEAPSPTDAVRTSGQHPQDLRRQLISVADHRAAGAR
jgi:hypothetical protein